MNNSVDFLIKDYLELVRGYVSQLREMSGQYDLVSAKRHGLIAGKGTLTSGAEYSFHGVGCRITSPSHVVDFDFGVNGQADGFDAWRLWEFAQSRLGKYPDLEDRNTVEKELQVLAESGKIQKSDQFPSPHLYIFCK